MRIVLLVLKLSVARSGYWQLALQCVEFSCQILSVLSVEAQIKAISSCLIQEGLNGVWTERLREEPRRLQQTFPPGVRGGGVLITRVFSLKKSIAVPFLLSFRYQIWNRKQYYDRRKVASELATLQNISSDAQKSRSWYFLGFHFKMSVEHPYASYMGFPHPALFPKKSGL